MSRAVHIVPAHDAQSHHLTHPDSGEHEACSCGAAPERRGCGWIIVHNPVGFLPSEWTAGWGNFYCDEATA